MWAASNNWRYKLGLTLVVVIASVFGNDVAYGKVVITENEITSLDISSSIEYVAGDAYAIDKLNPPEPETMLLRLGEFRKLPAALDLGIKDSPIWLTYELENKSSDKVRVYFEMPRVYFWSAQMFKVQAGVISQRSKLGIEVSSLDQALIAPDTVFNVIVESGETIRLLLYTMTDGPVDLTTKISTTRDFIAASYRINNLNGIFFGIMVSLMAYCFYNLVTLKERLYLYFLGTMTSVTLLFATLNGFGVSFLWPNVGHWNRSLLLVFSGISMILSVRTVVSSQGKNMTVTGVLVAQAATIVSFCCLVMSLLLPDIITGTKGVAINISIIGAIIGMLATSVISYGSYKRGFRPALLLTIAFMPFLVSTILRAMALFGVANGVFLENIVHQLSAGIAMILMSMSLDDRQVYLRNRQIVENEAIRLKNQELIENDKLKVREQEATLRVTQMLAHDVRKPFSLLRMGVHVLARAKDYQETQALVTKMKPEIDAAAASVDALILDIMEMGSTGSGDSSEVVAPDVLISDTLRQTFIMHPQADISIDYDLQHSTMLFVNSQKVMRVFANIYANAIQAMRLRGKTWFKSRDVIQGDQSYVEFCIGNSGSSIPADHIAKIFDAFFTSGKNNGTGLGLAVARKVVTSYGGRIWCESIKSEECPEGKVEFYFTLPVANGHPAAHSRVMYKTAAEYLQPLAMGSVIKSANERLGDENNRLLEAQIIQRSLAKGQPFKILIVDDDKNYSKNVAGLVARPTELAKAIHVVQTSNSTDALMAVGQQSFDLIISDVDLGMWSESGFDLVRKIRDRSHGSLICMHSNRIVSTDHKLAAKVGADLYIPKPLAVGQLLRLILQSQDVSQHRLGSFTGPGVEVQATQTSGQTEVVIIDDNPFVLDAWQAELRGQAKVHLFRSFDELSQMLTSEPEFLKKVRCVVIDLYLEGSEPSGIEIGRMLKARRPDVPILLSSDAVIDEATCRGAVDRIIGKEPLSLQKLCA